MKHVFLYHVDKILLHDTLYSLNKFEKKKERNASVRITLKYNYFLIMYYGFELISKSIFRQVLMNEISMLTFPLVTSNTG